MKTVKIAYSDCPNFDFEHFYLTEAMRPFCNPVLSDDPDIVFYSCYAREHMKYQNALKVFFNGENVHPDFNECDYAISCQPIQYGNRYFRLSDFDITMDASVNDRRGLDVSDKTRFCNFIYSNDHRDQEGARLRMEFCRLLMAYKHVDCPGRVLHNLDAPELVGRLDRNRSTSKKDFIRQYKFTIAWENTYGEGYTTEKLSEPLMAGSVPIYWGSVPDYINPKSIVDVSKFANLNEVVDFVRFLDHFGLLPRFLIDLSPFHTSMFITNLASINTTNIYHHIYEFGTTSVFLSMGKSIPNYLTGDLDSRLMPISVVMDERICTGHDYALFNRTLRNFLSNPELMERRHAVVKK